MSDAGILSSEPLSIEPLSIEPWTARDLPRLRRIALLVGLAWIALAAIGWIFERDAFYRAYLSAWLLWLGIALGSMGIVMLHHLLRGNWGIMVRRFGEHAACTMPLLAVLFVPVCFGLRSLFPWARPDVVADDPVIAHKAAYLNAHFFLVRAAICFVIWTLMAWYLRSRSLRHDSAGDARTALSLYNLSAGGMVIYFLTMSFGSFDWIMSREPHWSSTVFGWMVIVGQGLSGLCCMVICFCLLHGRSPYRLIARRDYFNDLGNLLLTFVIVWTYLEFAQLLVIWMGNRQDEIPWYTQRLSNGWTALVVILLLFHFFVPFFVLLMRELKRRAPVLLVLCAMLLVMRAIDNFWMVGASGSEPRPLLRHVISWMDFVFSIGMGGLWLAMFLWLAEGHPLIPEGAAMALPMMRPVVGEGRRAMRVGQSVDVR